MLAVFSLLAAVTCGATSLQQAQVFFPDHDGSAVVRRQIDSTTLASVIADRIGVSNFYTLGHQDSNELDFLNLYSRASDAIFGDAHRKSQIVLFIEDVVDSQDIIPDGHAAAAMSTSPSPAQNRIFIQDMLAQASQTNAVSETEFCSIQFPGSDGITGGVLMSLQDKDECQQIRQSVNSPKAKDDSVMAVSTVLDSLSPSATIRTLIAHVTILKESRVKSHEEYTAAAARIRSLVRACQDLDASLSVILFPQAHGPSTSTNPWTYGSNDKEYKLSRREEREAQHVEEAAMLSSSLSGFSSSAISTKSQASSSSSDSSTVTSSASTSSSTASSTGILTSSPRASTSPTSSPAYPPLPTGVIPQCHSSLEVAISATNNCSGHGSVYKKSSGRSGDGESSVDCYACRCSSSKIEHDDGTIQTIHWAGAACQKKDVSMPFFLLGGITLALLGVTGWSVSLLASVGQQDLPSVIGAGVAGPRARK